MLCMLSHLWIPSHPFIKYTSDSLYPCDAMWRQRCQSTLFTLKACRPIGTKQLTKPVLIYFLLDPWDDHKWIVNEKNSFLRKYIWKIWKMSSWKGGILFRPQRVKDLRNRTYDDLNNRLFVGSTMRRHNFSFITIVSQRSIVPSLTLSHTLSASTRT